MTAQTEHPCFEQPADAQSPVWRYLSFSKLLDFVVTRSLWYARLDLLPDPYEGTYPEAIRKRTLALEQVMAKQQSGPVARAPGLASIMRPSVYVNCWCLHPEESNALWRIYGGGDGGVALRTTYARLVGSLPDEDFIGVVRYIDYSRDSLRSPNALDAAMHKRIVFNYESEVRIVRWGVSTVPADLDFSKSPHGFRVNVDPAAAIDAIVVSPYAPSWTTDVLTEIVNRFNVGVPVRRSSMNAEPFHDFAPVSEATSNRFAQLFQVHQ